MTTVRNDNQGVSLGPNLSIVHVFHVIPLQAICGWPVHYPGKHQCRNGEVSSNSVTINATKFVEPHKFHIVST
jgi:hypothetical protein